MQQLAGGIEEWGFPDLYARDYTSRPRFCLLLGCVLRNACSEGGLHLWRRIDGHGWAGPRLGVWGEWRRDGGVSQLLLCGISVSISIFFIIMLWVWFITRLKASISFRWFTKIGGCCRLWYPSNLGILYTCTLSLMPFPRLFDQLFDL